MTDVVPPALGADSPHLPAPRARTLWSGFGAAVGLILGGGAGAAAALAADLWPLAPAVGLLAAVGGGWFGRAAWRSRTWMLGSTALELRRGVIVRRAASIPYHRIQQIDVERGPVDRLVGLAQLVVRTAAATTDAALLGLAPHDASRIRQRLLELAGVDDAV